ncbi:hypothetical protein GCM10011342_04270 [Aquisalinus flavus]|uniref:Transcription regulator PadR N-terminal domain-containing protein n=1 Tax=Aquisalinus flavus TaxID=1526572 RepID=A0A8J2Y783_9PROT|nr:PadR family transcriptional regulator [Aquisalinus flavus]MBD0427113.1 PadR family transcriptional regulator [Aquisalinus flavus]GGC98492.1 hypothetical protein GCM10011342_04270 [Aquisalinus flavus]
MKTLTPLNYALLGLLNRTPLTGYEMMQVFETTPLGGYSSSPGAIYPALKKLRQSGLVAVSGDGTSGRGDALAITPDGKAALKAWLLAPLLVKAGGIDLSGQMLKFTFTGDLLTRRQQMAFLNRLEKAITRAIDALAASRERMRDTLTSHDLLAVEAGLLQYRAAADWCALARQTLSKGK